MPRNYQKKTLGLSYTKQDLEFAVMDVQNKNKTYRQAEAAYGVPISVISQRLNGRKTSVASLGQGRKPALSIEVENKIVECIMARARMGYPCDRNELMTLVGEYVNTNGIKTPFKNGKPGIDWYYSFMMRHNRLTLKKPEHLQKCRKDARKPDVIFDFFEQLKGTLESLKINDQSKASFFFNADETAFPNDPSRLRAIGEKGKALSRISGGSGRDNTTVLACVAADGTALPPMIVFKATCVQARWTSEQAYPDTLYAATTNGWMEEPPFYEWFCKGFIKHVERIRTVKNLPDHPAVLLYDGHCSHISLRIIEKAINGNITLIKLPSHVTDKLQPLDKCVFGPLKTFWDKLLVVHGKKEMGRGSGRLSKQQFSEFLGKAWVGGMKADNIISGFKNTGMFPVDVKKFPESEFSAKALEEWKKQLQQTSNENDGLINLEQTRIDSPSQTVTTSVDQVTLDMSMNIDGEKLVNHNSREIQKETENEPIPSCSNWEKDSHSDSHMTPKSIPVLCPIENIFFKPHVNLQKISPENNKVTPRLRQQKYGEVLTTDEVRARLKEAEMKKAMKTQKRKLTGVQTLKKNKGGRVEGEEKVKGRNVKIRPDIADKKTNQKKKKICDNASSSSDGEVSFNSDSSDIDIELHEEDEVDLQPITVEKLNNGDFILASFKGGARKTTVFKYVCVVEEIDGTELKVMGLKSVDDTKTEFSVVHDDVSYIGQDDILGVLPFPKIVARGERIFYNFNKKVPVIER